MTLSLFSSRSKNYKFDLEFNELLAPDIELEIKTAKFIQKVAEKDLIQSSNDISRGGIFMSLVKMTQKNLGFL